MENSNNPLFKGMPLTDLKVVADPKAPPNVDGATGTERKANKQSPPTPAAQPTQIKAATWQNLPVTEDWCPKAMRPLLPWTADFSYKDNREETLVSSSGWRLLAATRRGKMHANDGTHREDAYATMAGENFLVLAVSDGAGSSQYSRIGSEMAVREVSKRIYDGLAAKLNEPRSKPPEKLPDSDAVAAIMEKAVDETVHLLREVASASGCRPQDLRCTLLVAVLLSCKDGGHIVLGQVGDGFFASLNPQDVAVRHGTSDSGDFSGQVNTFVPDEDSQQKFHDSLTHVQAQEVVALILCSDGIEDPFYPIEKNAAVIFHQLSVGVTTPLPDFTRQEAHGAIIGGGDLAHEILGRWLAFEKRGENDDRTVLVLHQEPFVVRPSTIQPCS